MDDKRIPVVIDCDPGVDDILALMLAFKSEKLDVRAVTAVAGNVELDRTLANALKVVSFAGADVPVARGADKPMCCALVTAKEVHGVDGMLGVSIPDTSRKPDPEPAWDVIWREARKANGKLNIIAVGPFTNIAIALHKYPRLPEYVERIIIMGGTFVGGNTTPAAEFNVLVDPEAAQKVLTSGIPVYICPLDVTHKAYITCEEAGAIEHSGGDKAEYFGRLAARGYEHVAIYTGGRGVPMHDPCAVLFAEDSSLFTFEQCSAVVETRGLITRGRMVTDLWSDKQLGLNNAYIVYDVDRERFIKRVNELVGMYR